MKLKLKATQEQIELIKMIGSRNLTESRKAQDMLAAFIAEVISKVLAQAGTASLIYTDSTFNEDDDPSIPLELFYDQNETQWVTVWSQAIAGGLPTSQVSGVAELKVSTYRLDSAVSFAKKYARKSRLDVISKAVERMAQEILVKQERNAWAVIMRAVSEARTNGNLHILECLTENVFQLDDMNTLMTLIRRFNTSWASGTPTSLDSFGLTDLFVSPEIKEQIRAFAYEPMNTRAGTMTSSGATAVPLPDSIREQIYRNVGTSEIYGVNIHDLNELGLSQKYNTLFQTFAGALGVGKNSTEFVSANDEALIGFDLGRECFIRPLAQNADNGGTVVSHPDDQWVIRSEKAGFYTAIEEGRLCLDGRGVCALVV